MTQGELQPSDDNKEALRNRIAKIIHDFDHRIGAFKSLSYCSPRDLVTDDWAQYAGCTIPELRDAVTAWRTSVPCRNSLDARTSKIVDDLKRAVDRWRLETGYKKRPAGLEKVHKYKNRSELASYISATLTELGLEVRFPVSRHRDQMAFSARFADAFRHSVSVGGQVKFAYGGGLRAWLHFPYYDHSYEPTQLSIEHLIGWGLCVFLEIGSPECMIWTADRGKDAFPSIDGYMRILGTVCDYLRAKELQPEDGRPSSFPSQIET